jgi:hypothetical protein
MGNGELNQPNGGLSSFFPHYNGHTGTLRKPLFNPYSMVIVASQIWGFGHFRKKIGIVGGKLGTNIIYE